ncbi:pullulanase [Alkalicoccus daliensis]|uniref:pullulanase n=1 Tax=Alkalicoccus daliensis TaxID=745820 RepID=UPI000B8457FA|nr:pullulanase [Alkalicoccus daliensis]
MYKRKTRRSALMMTGVMGLSIFSGFAPAAVAEEEQDSGVDEGSLRVHYDYGDKDVTQLGVWFWGDVAEEPTDWPDGSWFSDYGTTDFGAYVDIELAEDASSLGLVINNRGGENVSGDIDIDILAEEMDEVWITQEEQVYYYEPEALEGDTLRVNFQAEGEYEPWGLWTWGSVAEELSDWPMDAHAFSSEQTGRYGAYHDLALAPNASGIGFLLVKRDESAEQSGDMNFGDFDTHSQIFLREGDDEVYTNPYFVSTGAEEEDRELKEGEYDISVSGSVKEAFHYNENAVLEVHIENNSDVEVDTIYADTSALGGSSELAVSPELEAVSIAAAYDTEPGTYDLPITAIDEEGGMYQGSATAEVTERSKEEGEFDWDEAMIYFMLTDRFADGNPDNNDPYGLDYAQYDDENPRGTYQGGDFAGVTENLDYLDDLGVNTVWITPIVENIAHDVEWDASAGNYFGYHGYWASDFEELNPHLGTLEEFHTLIDEAAARDMKIMVDVVLNHPGYDVRESDQLPEGEAPDGYPGPEIVERFDGMIRDNPGSDDQTMELAGLPDFETENPEVRNQLVDWQTAWLDRSTTENGNAISYYRVDTVKHVDDTTWQHFKNELTEKDSEFKMIGESWGANQNDDQGYLQTGTMDSLLDFGFKNSARDFARGNLESVNEDLQERNAGMDNTSLLGQFLGSHDEEGFLYNHGEEALLIGAALQITAKGQPVIYYGEELGQSGDDNWPQYDNRYDFAWSEVEDSEIHKHYQKLLQFRGEHSEIFARGGRSETAGSDEEEFLVFDRTHNGESVFVGLNVADEAQEVTLGVEGADTVVTDAYSGETYASENNQVTITLPAKADGGTVLLTADNGTIVGEEAPAPEEPSSEIPENHLRVHYDAGDTNVSTLGVWYWDGAAVPSEENASWPGDERFSEENSTDFGPYIDIELEPGADRLSMLINNTGGDNITGDVQVDLISERMNEIWLYEDGSYVLAEPVNLGENEVRVHYDRENDDYENWAVWSFEDVAVPSGELGDWPDGATEFEGTGRYGAYLDVELTEDAEEIGFLFLNKETGEQTNDMSFSDLERYNQIFVQEGTDTAFNNPYYTTQDGLRNAEVLSEERIELTFSGTENLTENQLFEGIQITDRNGDAVAFDRVTIEDDGVTVNLHGTFDLDLAPFTVTFNNRSASAMIGWRLKDELYSYDGNLGAELHEDGSVTLKLWSPSADNVSITLYDKDDQDSIVAEDVDMERQDRGVWEVTLDAGNTGVENHTGYYYHYMIERDGETVEALDPYAPSMAAWNSDDEDSYIGKAAIVDPSSIGPELDFAEIEGFEKREDAIIYELHVRDFTSDPSIEDELENEFGTFGAFAERLDYLEDLGVTHVQLLPVMSYFFSNEFTAGERMLNYSSTQNNYNWGYDPHSYFSLTGMYSQDPEDAEKRIEEFKQLIHEIHERDMGVVLDVVYNHTARVHIFEDLEPNYYHFMDADGTSRVSFGGGRLGTTHEMARRILVDSIMYWVEEFKVDGFRFDMMGDHDAETIQIAYDKAKEVNPNIVMIGEGWVTYAGDENYPDVQPADQQWMQYTESVGSFSDDFRNELKSGFGSEGEPRFLTGGARDIERIYNNLTANPANFTATNPGDVVPYIAAHDNLTLHDVIAQSIQKDPKDHQEEIHQRIRLGNAMVLTAQGTAFLHGGQEFGRTKQFRHEDYIAPVPEGEEPYKSTYMEDADGNPFEYPYFIHDSYDSTDAINLFDWEKATDAEEYPINNVTQDMAAGMIELRRSTDAFTFGTMEEIDAQVSLIEAPEINAEDLLIGYRAESLEREETYHVFINADAQERTLSLEEDLTEGVIVADADEAGAGPVAEENGFALTASSITIDPLTAVIVKTGEVEESGPQKPGKPGRPDAPGPPSWAPGPPEWVNPGPPADRPGRGGANKN